MFQNWTNVTKNVSTWLGATKPDDDKDPIIEIHGSENEDGKKEEILIKTNSEGSNLQYDTEEVPTISGQLEEVSLKALNSAKEWGSFLFTVGKQVTADTVKIVKDTVEEKTIIGDFEKENEKFRQHKRDKDSKSEASVPPWVGFNEETEMKTQILSLSSDKRNFIRNPPSGIEFHFDFSTSYPVAMSMLLEDPNLNKMRFELVPKHVKEEIFWRNYFYRVSLIKQSAQLSSLEQDNSSTDDKLKTHTESSTMQDIESTHLEKDEEFVSDNYNLKLSEDDLGQGREELGINNDSNLEEKRNDDEPEWDKLAAELQEFEVVADADDELDQEILAQIEKETAS